LAKRTYPEAAQLRVELTFAAIRLNAASFELKQGQHETAEEPLREAGRALVHAADHLGAMTGSEMEAMERVLCAASMELLKAKEVMRDAAGK